MQAATARITEPETELAEMKDRWIRAEAETSNVRGGRQADDTCQYGVPKFATGVVEANLILCSWNRGPAGGRQAYRP